MLTEKDEDTLDLYNDINQELLFLKSIQPRIKELYNSRELETIVIQYWEYFDAHSRVGGFDPIDSFALQETFKRNECEIIYHPVQDEIRDLWEYENEFSHLISKYEKLLSQIKQCLSL